MPSLELVRFLLVLLLLACTPPPKPPEDAGMKCDVVAPTQCNDAGTRYGDVKPAIDTHCVPCHYGQVGGPWPLTRYEDVADWQDTVRDDIANCSMPPADAGTVMSTAEKQLVLDWLRCGYPR